jgi:copper chaperone NosL
MTSIFRFTFFVLFFSLALAACQPMSSGPQPPDIAYGQEVCEQCGMIISEAQYAAASVLTDGTTRKFDDIAEMVMYHMDHPDQPISAWFVHDYNTEVWIRGESAFYVMSADLATPMGGGVVAFEKESDAESFAQFKGVTALNFDEMRAMVHMTLH